MRYMELLAESSLVFTAFTTLIFSLSESDNPRVAFRAWSVVVQGFIVFGTSLLPLLLFQLALDERTLWRISSATAFVVMVAFTVFIPKTSVQLTQRGHPPLAPRMLWCAFGVSTIGCFFVFANFVGWPGPPSSFLYGAGLTLFLAVSVSGVVAKFWLLLAKFINQPDPK
jgi:hypothetical protein